MEEIKRQVSRAHHRMVLQQFFSVLVWSMLAALSVALVAVTIPKIWALGVNPSLWAWSWIGGTIAAGLIIAVLWTYLIRYQPLEAAVEIDRRYGLKERVSSTLALKPAELETEAAYALMSDTARRIERVDVTEKFGVQTNWRALLPLLPVIAVVCVMFLDDASNIQQAKAHEQKIQEKKRVEEANNQLKKKIQQIRKNAAEKDLKDAEVFFKNVEQRLDELSKSKDGADRTKALVRLNDLKKDIEKRKQQIGDADQMRKHLDQLKDVQQGPADKAVRAMKEGDFGKALNEITKLTEQLKEGDLDEEQVKQLADQLEQMANKMKDVADAHEQAKRDLEEQINKAEKEGDIKKAGELQQKLDQLKQQDKQMEQMRKMADKLGQCSECMKPGNGQKASADQMAQAGQALSDIADQLEQMQSEMDELESLDDVMDQIAQAKNSMNCEQCGGAGCRACNGLGQGGDGDRPGFGLGEGKGQGERPEQETDTGHYLSKVGSKPKAGEAVNVGDTGGANIAGLTKEQAQAEVTSSMSKDSDPLTNQRLPRSQRDHAKEYFERFRNGE